MSVCTAASESYLNRKAIRDSFATSQASLLDRAILHLGLGQGGSIVLFLFYLDTLVLLRLAHQPSAFINIDHRRV